MATATAGLIIKNAAVSLVNGVYEDYTIDESNHRRWLSADKTCIIHFIDNKTIYSRSDLDLNAMVVPEMTLQNYYRYNSKEPDIANAYDLIRLSMELGGTINDQLGNNTKTPVDNSDGPARLLTVDELAPGLTGDRIYWLCDIAQTQKAADIKVPIEDLNTVKTRESRTKAVTIANGEQVNVVLRESNVPATWRTYVQVGDSEEKFYATERVIRFTAGYGDSLKVSIEKEESTSTETTNTTTTTTQSTNTTNTEGGEEEEPPYVPSIAQIDVQYAMDGTVYLSFNAATLDIDTEHCVTNDNTANTSTQTYIAELFYSEPKYYLCDAYTANYWAISRIDRFDAVTGEPEHSTELYCGFVDSDEVSPYDGIPWIVYSTNGNGAIDANIRIERWDSTSYRTTIITEEDPDGAKRTTTTFTNIITGETHRDIQIVREKIIPTNDVHRRYDFVNLIVGQVYRFRFVKEFAELGWDPSKANQPANAGIYKVDGIMSYYDMVAGRIDLFVNLYERCGVSRLTFDLDKKRFADSVIYRLVDPEDESNVIFMPQIFIEGQPDASVLKYNKLLLMIDLGIQPNSNTVEALRNETDVRTSNDNTVKVNLATTHSVLEAWDQLSGMSELLRKVLQKEYGLTATATNPLFEFTVYGHTWLTDEGWNEIRADREAAKKHNDVDYNTLFNLEESNKWYKEYQIVNNKYSQLETLIKQLFSKRTEDQS